MMKSPKMFFTISVLFFVIVALLIVIIKSLPKEEMSKTIEIPKIEFAMAADENISDHTEFTFDINDFDIKFSQEKALVYLDPVSEKHIQLIKNLGFDENEFSISENEKIYENDEITLKIDDYGVFEYKNNKSEGNYDKIKISSDECIKKAQEFLTMNNLMTEELVLETNVSEGKMEIWDPETEKVIDTYITNIDVYFFMKPIDDMNVLGNVRINISFDSDGEISNVFYNYRKYEETVEVELKSIEAAYESIFSESYYEELNEPSSKLIFESVYLNYWERAVDKDNLTRQPVYTFTGTSITSTGKEEPFSIVVEAMKR